MTVNYRDLLYSRPPNIPRKTDKELEKKPIEPKKAEEQAAKRRIVITDRDWRLFRVLERVRCLSQKQIEALLKFHGGTYRNRLLRLYRAGYLKRLTYGRRGGLYST